MLSGETQNEWMKVSNISFTWVGIEPTTYRVYRYMLVLLCHDWPLLFRCSVTNIRDVCRSDSSGNGFDIGDMKYFTISFPCSGNKGKRWFPLILNTQSRNWAVHGKRSVLTLISLATLLYADNNVKLFNVIYSSYLSIVYKHSHIHKIPIFY